jgi:hypothetical protein
MAKYFVAEIFAAKYLLYSSEENRMFFKEEIFHCFINVCTRLLRKVSIFRLILSSVGIFVRQGEINVDQTALAELLGSDQKSARVTFVRIGEEGAIVENQVRARIFKLFWSPRIDSKESIPPSRHRAVVPARQPM